MDFRVNIRIQRDENVEWRKLDNKELHSFYGSPTIRVSYRRHYVCAGTQSFGSQASDSHYYDLTLPFKEGDRYAYMNHARGFEFVQL